MLGARNYIGLTEDQIERCRRVWAELCGDITVPLDVSEAALHGSRTRYDVDSCTVVLGANAYLGSGQSANSRLSLVACLAHELAHKLRADMDFDRPYTPPDVYLDEAEASIHASFLSGVSPRDRVDLVEDARDRIFLWLAFPRE